MLVFGIAALTLSAFLVTLFFIAVGLGMLSGYYMRNKSPKL